MKRLLTSNEPISRQFGARGGARCGSVGPGPGNSRIAPIEPSANSAATPKVRRSPMLSARMPPIDGPHTVATMIAPMNSEKLRARFVVVACSSTCAWPATNTIA